MSNGSIDRDFLNSLYKKMGQGAITSAAEAEQKGYTVDRSCYPWVAYKGSRFDPTEFFYILTDNENHLVDLLNDASAKMEEASEFIDQLTKNHKTLKINYQATVHINQLQKKLIAGLKEKIRVLKSGGDGQHGKEN